MNLTTRGRVVTGIAGGAFVWALIFRLHSLNAVIISSAVAIGIGAALLTRVEEPVVERFTPKPGHVGDRRIVQFRVRAGGRPSATIVDRLPKDVRPVEASNRLDRVLDGQTVEYEVVPERRGVHRLGPLSIEVTDPFGLVARTFEIDASVEFVAYPPVYHLAGLSAISLIRRGGINRERNEFDRVREYESSDALRDIHWRSTAKRPNDLVVKEFIARSDANRSRIVAECDAGAADAMATAAASLAIAFMNDGVDVGLTLADETIPLASGSIHRARLLEALARTEGGTLAEVPDGGALRIYATTDGRTQVTVGDRTVPFERFRHQAIAANEPTEASEGSHEAIAADGGVPG